MRQTWIEELYLQVSYLEVNCGRSPLLQTLKEQKLSNNPLQILIGDYSVYELPLGEDLRMVKAALLYGDKAKLCSATSSMAVTMLSAAEPKPKQKMEILKWLAPIVDEDKEEATALVQCCDFYVDLAKKKHFNRDELLFRLKFERNIEEIWVNTKEVLTLAMEQLGGSGLLQAVDSKLFESSAFRKVDNPNQCLLDFIKQMSGDSVLPMFKTPNAMDGEVAELPTLDAATIEEILTIRNEMEAPLTSLKTALVSCSRTEIEAAVKEVQAAFESSALVKEIKERQAPAEGSALYLLMLPMFNYPEHAAHLFRISDPENLADQEAYMDWKNQHSDESKLGLMLVYDPGTPIILPETEETEQEEEAEAVGVE